MSGNSQENFILCDKSRVFCCTHLPIFLKWVSTFNSYLLSVSGIPFPQSNHISKNTLKCEFINQFSGVNHQATHFTMWNAWTQQVSQRLDWKAIQLSSVLDISQKRWNWTRLLQLHSGKCDFLLVIYHLPLKHFADHPPHGCLWHS